MPKSTVRTTSRLGAVLGRYCDGPDPALRLPSVNSHRDTAEAIAPASAVGSAHKARVIRKSYNSESYNSDSEHPSGW